MADYSKIPAGATLDAKPFKAHIDEEKLQHMKQLLELSPVAPPVFENTNAGRMYGMERSWLENAKKFWLNRFNWRSCEERVNSFPNFKASVEDEQGNTIEVQFLALFSEKTDAVPLAIFHGWPGSICEFLDILDLLRQHYSAKDLPYHVIVPSLPGYAYSSGPPVEVDYDVELVAGVMHKLMVGLGFGSGYLAQGGDLGSFVSRVLALKYEACKGIHVNMMLPNPGDADVSERDEQEIAILTKLKGFMDTDYAFSLEQGTRPATIGLVLSSSPLALLSWIGEKILAWTDEDPSLEKILESVTLYWLTDTIPRALYHSREFGDPGKKPKMARISAVLGTAEPQVPYIEKPCGYSLFAHEIIPVPRKWAATTCNLVSFNQHEHGGHFAAMERPAELLEDLENYVRKVWPSIAGGKLTDA